MFKFLQVVDYNTDELNFVLNNVNPINEAIYRIAYSIAKQHNSDIMDNNIRQVMGKADSLDTEFKSIHLNTIFKESLRGVVANLGLPTTGNPTLPILLDIYTGIDIIRNSDSLVSVLVDYTKDDADIFDIAEKLDVPLSEYSEFLEEDSKLIDILYSENADSITIELLTPQG